MNGSPREGRQIPASQRVCPRIRRPFDTRSATVANGITDWQERLTVRTVLAFVGVCSRLVGGEEAHWLSVDPADGPEFGPRRWLFPRIRICSCTNAPSPTSAKPLAGSAPPRALRKLISTRLWHSNLASRHCAPSETSEPPISLLLPPLKCGERLTRPPSKGHHGAMRQWCEDNDGSKT